MAGESKQVELFIDPGCTYQLSHSAELSTQWISSNVISVMFTYENTSSLRNLSIAVLDNSGKLKYTLPVSVGVVTPSFSGGKISCHKTSIDYGSSPGTIYNSSLPQGGECAQNYIFTWEKSDFVGVWNKINGAIDKNYVCPALFKTTTFRRKAVCSSNEAYSDYETIYVGETPNKLLTTDTKNHVVTYAPSKSVIDVQKLWLVDMKDFGASVSYVDAMGRNTQTVSVASSPNAKDVMQVAKYDEFGLQTRDYMPFAMATDNKGAYHMNAYNSTNWQAHYPTEYENAHSDKEFEKSPLNRVMKQGAPGSTWQLNSGHEIKMKYELNVTLDKVISFSVNNEKLVNDGYYPDNHLYKTVIHNENGSTDSNLHSTVEFKDMQGQVVLKRNFVLKDNAEITIDTYYVYNNLGQLSFVLPPKAVQQLDVLIDEFEGTTEVVTENLNLSSKDSGIDTYLLDKGASLTLSAGFTFTASVGNELHITAGSSASELCYEYRYDDRGRLIEKKLPGAGLISMVYDKRDRLAATQDANMKESKWLFTKYDGLDRSIATGLYSSGLSRDNLQTVLNNESLMFEVRTLAPDHKYAYTNITFPKAGTIEYLTVTYYDDYDFPYKKNFVNGTLASSPSNNVRGQVTGTRVKVLGSTQWLDATSYYDSKYRTVQSIGDLYGGGTANASNQYDHVGNVTQSREVQTVGGVTNTVDQFFDYDHAGRLLKLEHQINGGTKELIAEMTYNELGQLEQKKLGANLQAIDYEYNIRGWLTSINKPGQLGSDLFAMELKYDSGLNELNADAQYNGNISAITWEGKKFTGVKTYGYSYDGLNRLQNANYAEGTSYSGNKDAYNMSVGSYDTNGNIESLIRKQNGELIDELNYSYSGNQLLKVEDINNDLGFTNGATKSQEYIYDANGNMTKDENKSMTVSYNYLNLPSTMVVGSTTIEYIYDALGNKLAKKLPANSSNSLYYRGSFVYKGSSLSYILHSEGMLDVAPSGATQYQYHLKDHLGNVRSVFSAGNIEIPLQEQQYYPFGMQMGGLSLQGSINKYKYNGKEYQEETKLYDYGARMYDASLGRWSVVDPMAESYYSQSTYHFSGNNPINFIDQNGMNYDNYNIYMNSHEVEREIVPGSTIDNFYVYQDRMLNIPMASISMERNQWGYVKFPSNGDGFDRYSYPDRGGMQTLYPIEDGTIDISVARGDHYLYPQAAASLLGLTSEWN